MRNLLPHDQLFALAGRALAAVAGSPASTRPMPAEPELASELTPEQRRLSGALMRVNHVGEVCAQALYESQALTARDPEVRERFRRAAQEEGDHLAWTRERLQELGDRPSMLNPLWYAGSFAIGAIAGRLGDRASLGFMAETERQVEQHLEGHLARLPAQDERSRAIVDAMRRDEHAHAQSAVTAGADVLPLPARVLMRLAARVMTTTAHYV